MQRRAGDPAQNQYSDGSAGAEGNRIRMPGAPGDGGIAPEVRFAEALSIAMPPVMSSWL